jgi:glycosyltransferase involved in cell wall biosynthesis
LESLSKQKPQPYEVVLSDDSDISSLIKFNKGLAHRYGCKYIKGPARGLYANRNFVAKHCCGTHIRTMDDDHEFPVGHIQACLEAIESDPETIWTIGESYPDGPKLHLPVPIPGQLHPRGFSAKPNDMLDYYGISCGATIYPRSVVDKGILNLELYAFGMLYLEYGARLVNNGYRIGFLDSTYVVHHYDEKNRSVSSLNILNSARIFSMIMFSFYHKRSLRNRLLTVCQIATELLKNYYSLNVVIHAYKNYINESRKLQLIKS